MSDSGESDQAERLSDLDEIAEALRAGELDATARFAERRTEHTDGSTEESDGRPPGEILEGLQTDDTESGDDHSGRELVRAELEVRVPRSESGSLQDRTETVLTQALAPEIPSDSIHVGRITNVDPELNGLQVQVEVAIEAKIVVQRILSESASKGGAPVELLP